MTAYEGWAAELEAHIAKLHYVQMQDNLDHLTELRRLDGPLLMRREVLKMDENLPSAVQE